MFETMSTTTHICTVIVPEGGYAVLYSSSPSLIATGIFDGVFLLDNIDNKDKIPSEHGIYECLIKCESSSHFDYYSGGTEYELSVNIETVRRLSDVFNMKAKTRAQRAA